MTSRGLWLPLLAALFASAAAGAVDGGDPESMREFDSPQQQERYWALLGKLRCLVCQNQSLSDSDADLAQDLRDEVYVQMAEKGKTNEAIVDYLVDRYGDFVLYRPPFEPSTYLLWLGPFLLLAIGFGVLVVVVRRRQQALTQPLSEAERARVSELLENESDEDKRE
ncbi:cytochrome c-type biogenesis protein [Thiohalorhabdus sp.]|uniref:cytochrome c-type biogenesis protein n=1 Tax=Thiohalorhabdus sp. TaxID=3094134 RepID=UPI002FC32FB9